MIYFIGYNKHINLLYYLFSSETNKNEYIKERKINTIEIEDPKSLTCQVNKNENELICFYIYRPYLFVEIFDINRNFETIYKNNITFNFQDNNNITLKSSITSNAKKILLVWEQIGNSAFYNYFICKERIFKTSISLDGCESTKQLMEIYYDNPNNQFIYFCQSKDDPSQFLVFKVNKDSINFNEPEEKYAYHGFNTINDGIYYYNLKFNDECNFVHYFIN